MVTFVHPAKIPGMFGVAEYAFPVDLSNWIENCRVKTRGFKTRGSPDLLRNILVATDVAARGLDLKHVSVVVSYNPAVPALQNSERSGLLEPKKTTPGIYLEFLWCTLNKKEVHCSSLITVDDNTSSYDDILYTGIVFDPH